MSQIHDEAVCRTDAAALSQYRRKLADIADSIIGHCDHPGCFTHIDFDPIPSEGYVIDIIHKLKEILFPGYFNREKIDPVNLKFKLGDAVSQLFDTLSVQISHSIRHECFRHQLPCSDCGDRGYQIALDFLGQTQDIRLSLGHDVRAAFDGDPAAKSYDEVIFSYPGIFAIMVYRAAHVLYQAGVPLLPRIMTEHAHSVTGIDIHPGATIGDRFVIDHGTGVVIGETTVIGHNVRIYQGVTLGALSLPKDAGNLLRGKKRHPTIEDDVIIYSGATILGGDTIIGARSVIGGNVWLTSSVPPDTRVLLENPKLVFK